MLMVDQCCDAIILFADGVLLIYSMPSCKFINILTKLLTLACSMAVLLITLRMSILQSIHLHHPPTQTPQAIQALLITILTVIKQQIIVRTIHPAIPIIVKHSQMMVNHLPIPHIPPQLAITITSILEIVSKQQPAAKIHRRPIVVVSHAI